MEIIFFQNDVVNTDKPDDVTDDARFLPDLAHGSVYAGFTKFLLAPGNAPLSGTRFITPTDHQHLVSVLPDDGSDADNRVSGFHPLKPGTFINTKHNVEILDRLPRGTLTQVIQHCHNHGLIRSCVTEDMKAQFIATVQTFWIEPLQV